MDKKVNNENAKVPIMYTEEDVLQILNDIITDIRDESKKLDNYVDKTKLSGYRANIELAKQVGLDKAIIIVIAKSVSVAEKSISFVNFNEMIEKVNQQIVPITISSELNSTNYQSSLDQIGELME